MPNTPTTYPTEWRVTCNVTFYQIWRQTRALRPGEPMHSGVREVQGAFATRSAAQRAADRLNKEAATDNV